MLEVADLHVAYGEVKALRGVSLSVPRGSVVGIIGSNGAGKTTLLKTVSGLLRPSAGDIRLEGDSLVALAPHRVTRKGVVQTPEGRHVFGAMTVRENLIAAQGWGVPRRQVEAQIQEMFGMFPVLAEKARQPAGTLSGGQQQMLAIARSLMSRPRLLMLDEPSLGLAPVIVDEVFDALGKLRYEGMTMLMVEQNATRALSFVDYCYVLERGVVAAQGASSALLDDTRIVDHYLGGTRNH